MFFAFCNGIASPGELEGICALLLTRFSLTSSASEIASATANGTPTPAPMAASRQLRFVVGHEEVSKLAGPLAVGADAGAAERLFVAAAEV